MDYSTELFPIPLVLAAEADVDNAMQELLDPDTPEDIKISLTGQCRSYGTKSWLYLVIVTLNYLHTSRDLQHSRLGIPCEKASPHQLDAIEKLCSYVNLIIDYEPAAFFPNYVEPSQKA